MPCPEKFKESLVKFNIDGDVVDTINAGYETLVTGSKKPEKAAYFRRAAELLDARADPKTRQALFEWNACCKGGQREKASKAFARENAAASLEEKLRKIPSVPNMGVPALNDDGSITVQAVRFFDGERYRCACSNFNWRSAQAPVSKTYCYCCAGHFLHHYEIMLGRRLRTAEIVSSPLSSGGEQPCVLRFELL